MSLASSPYREVTAADGEKFGVGRVVGVAFRLFGRNFGALTLLGFPLDGIPTLLIAVGWLEIRESRPALGALAVGVGWGLSAIFGALLEGTIACTLARNLQDRASSIREDLAAANRNRVGLSATNAIVVAAYAAFDILVKAPTFLSRHLGANGPVFGVVLAMVILFGAMPLLIWFLTTISVAVSSQAVEQTTTMVAVRRSFALTRGSRWPIIGVMLIAYLAALALAMLSWPLGLQLAKTAHVPIVLARLAMSALCAPLIGPLFSSVLAAIYFELRHVKEGVGSASIAAVFD